MRRRKGSASDLSQQAGEAEGSLAGGDALAGRKAALTTTGRSSTARWAGSGKRDGKVYVRNQRQKAPQEQTTSSNLADLGWAAVRTCKSCRELLGPVDVAGREATPKVCGVGVAKPQGHSWAPPPSNGLVVNVGTTLAVPDPAGFLPAEGTVRRRPTLPEWGGGPVVVRGRESRPHGEGVQRVRSIQAECGGRW